MVLPSEIESRVGMRGAGALAERVRSDAAAGDDRVTSARGARRDSATMSADGRAPHTRTVSRP